MKTIQKIFIESLLGKTIRVFITKLPAGELKTIEVPTGKLLKILSRTEDLEITDAIVEMDYDPYRGGSDSLEVRIKTSDGGSFYCGLETEIQLVETN